MRAVYLFMCNLSVLGEGDQCDLPPYPTLTEQERIATWQVIITCLCANMLL